jgi:small-conductance mechanosensitive channel
MTHFKTVQDILGITIFKHNDLKITVQSIILVFLTLFVTKILLLVLKRIIRKYAIKRRIEKGREFSIFQMIRYLIWVFSIVMCLQIFGIHLTFLLASGAALMVGIGLGLQNVFNDFVSGVIILLEGTIEVGDIIEVDGLVGKVKSIALRSSHVLTRNDIVIIVPNHKFIAENVINWTDHNEMVRFQIDVGVAYGSNTELVAKLLVEAAEENKNVISDKKPFARFNNFGDSSLDFQLFFWSEEVFRIDNITSDIRFAIDKKFRENNVTIPFPQRDLHLKSSDLTTIK